VAQEKILVIAKFWVEEFADIIRGKQLPLLGTSGRYLTHFCHIEKRVVNNFFRFNSYLLISRCFFGLPRNKIEDL
jgi:hypothetical protein